MKKCLIRYETCNRFRFTPHLTCSHLMDYESFYSVGTYGVPNSVKFSETMLWHCDTRRELEGVVVYVRQKESLYLASNEIFLPLH